MITVFTNIVYSIGVVVCAISGVVGTAFLLWLFFGVLCEMYINISYRFRTILKAEALIRDFRRERPLYEEWKRERGL